MIEEDECICGGACIVVAGVLTAAVVKASKHKKEKSE